MPVLAQNLEGEGKRITSSRPASAIYQVQGQPGLLKRENCHWHLRWWKLFSVLFSLPLLLLLHGRNQAMQTEFYLHFLLSLISESDTLWQNWCRSIGLCTHFLSKALKTGLSLAIPKGSLLDLAVEIRSCWEWIRHIILLPGNRGPLPAGNSLPFWASCYSKCSHLWNHKTFLTTLPRMPLLSHLTEKETEAEGVLMFV